MNHLFTTTALVEIKVAKGDKVSNEFFGKINIYQLKYQFSKMFF